MILEPSDLFEKVEYDKILQLLESECYGDLGKAAVYKIPLLTDVKRIDRLLREVTEYKTGSENADRLTISAYKDISEELRYLEVIDFVLAEEGLKKINVVLLFIRNIYSYFAPARQEQYPHLYDIIRPVDFDSSLIDAIEKVIDEEGNIRPDASPSLAKIRRMMSSKQRELERSFRSIINIYRGKGWLTDNVESFRNGRRVLSVPAEHKRKIRGIIHDESTTGKTAFIEPEGVIEINNDIFDLVTEEKKEIYRILKELSAVLRPYVSIMRKYMALIVRFDLIQAKATLGGKMRGVMPKLLNKPHLGIQMGLHPLLYLKNKGTDKETVPFDLQLFGQNRLLVLSGPNAGGKSITMKAVGLMQIMLQSGFLVPCDEISEFGIFENFFADIGDQQSIEDDLSTYSSRLKNMKAFLENADNKTLLLIDEFGSGTDPKIGGAIAEAILHEMNHKKVFGVITTHYSNIKVYAFKTKGIVNGSMLFDKDELAPTYQLKVGRPGSSFAFEIAEKSGLPGRILKYAKHKTGKNEKAVDALLVDLQKEKQELEQHLESIEAKQKSLDKLVKNYEQLHKEIEYKRKRLKLSAKEQELQQASYNNKSLERLIREIKEEKNLEKAKKLATTVRQERQTVSNEVSSLNKDIYEGDEEFKSVPKSTKKGAIEKDDYVRMRNGGSIGQVLEVKKNKVIVQMGIMRMEVKTRDLEHANAPLEVRSSKSVQMDTFSQNATFESKIDIRGMRMEEALMIVEEFVDKALITSAQNLRILHGKGNGVLRNAVKKKLREYPAVVNMWHPEANAGGDGVTLVELE